MPALRHSVVPGGQTAKSGRRILVLLAFSGMFGCATMRQQTSKRCEHCNALCKQACTVTQEGYPEQANLLLNEAMRQRPADLETRRQLAEALWSCGRQSDAIEEYGELIQLHPRDVRLQERLAAMLWSMGRIDDAGRTAEGALRLFPNSDEALLVKARTQAARNDLDAAAATYIRLSMAEPDRVEPKLELAEVHLKRGHAVQACSLLREVMLQSQRDPVQQVETEWKLGLTYAAANRWNEAADHLAHAAQTREASSTDWQLVMLATSRAGLDPNTLPSKALLASASQSVRSDSSAWTNLRDQLLQSDQVAQSPLHNGVIRADFSRSAQVDPPPASLPQ